MPSTAQIVYVRSLLCLSRSSGYSSKSSKYYGPRAFKGPCALLFCLCFCFCLLLVDFSPRAPPPVCHRPRTSLTPRFQGPRTPYAFGGVSILLSVEDPFFFFFACRFFPRAPPPVCCRSRTSLIRPCSLARSVVEC